MEINLRDSPFYFRLLFRYLSLILVAIQILVFFPVLEITDLAIFFLLKSLHDTVKRLFSGLSGSKYYQLNYIVKKRQKENLIYHYLIHFIISLLSALFVAFLAFLDSITFNFFDYFLSFSIQNYVFLIIWLATSFAAQPANYITQIFKKNMLTGFFTVFSSTFFITPIILIFYLKSNLNLSTLIFSYGFGNLINFLFVTFTIFNVVNIKYIPIRSISTFTNMINLNESLLNFTDALRWQSILWILSANGEDYLAIIFGFFNYIFPLLFYPSQQIYASLRTDFFTLVDSRSSNGLKKFINKISKMNVIYFSLITICCLLAFLFNDFILSIIKSFNLNYFGYFLDLNLLLISVFFAYLCSNLFFKSLEGVIIDLRRFNEANLINVLTVIILFISVFILGNFSSIFTWIISICISQFFRSALLYLYLSKVLKIV